jgi:hypothetical protein
MIISNAQSDLVYHIASVPLPEERMITVSKQELSHLFHKFLLEDMALSFHNLQHTNLDELQASSF